MAQNEARWRACVDGIRERDSKLLVRLYDAISGALYGPAVRVLNDPADAEEVILDVYQHLWNSIHRFDAARGTFWSWLVLLTRS
jgi:RNA polymerase sigma-70 factor (ECF subfamily)